MGLKESLEAAERNQKIKVEILDDEIKVSLVEDPFEVIVIVYPKHKTAEFLDVDPTNEWDELKGALERYSGFPEIIGVYNELCKEDYRITW